MLRVATSFEGVLRGADDPVGSAFFEVGAVLVALCRLRFRTSWKPSSCAGFPVGLPADLLAFNIDLKSFNVTVYMPYSALSNVFPESAFQ
jgi:hypothetical protein